MRRLIEIALCIAVAAESSPAEPVAAPNCRRVESSATAATGSSSSVE
ncbi:MAG TPA: hypothetical protein VF057_06300 [Thermoanaerobaculia bacterium]